VSAPAVAMATARQPAVQAARVAAAAEHLAAPSAVVAGALKLLDDERSSMHQVAERVGQSPELAAQVLRLGSAAVFGGPATTLDEAVVRLGSSALRGFLMAAGTYPLLAGSLAAYGLPRMALVGRANDVATAAGAIARHIAPESARSAHLAGLLHDIGMPILAEVADQAGIIPDVPIGDLAAERALFGTDHVRVGAWIARRWGLSEELAEAVAHHHDGEAPAAGTARSVWLAALVVRARRGDGDAAEGVVAGAAACGLDEESAATVLAVGDLEAAPTAPPGLTPREVEVLGLVAGGLAPKQVALRLGCSASTVHNHLHHTYQKLGVSGQAQALLLARERGWV